MENELIIYDLSKGNQLNGDNTFSANGEIKYCIGCFSCWLKTPGKCILRDGCTTLPHRISLCDKLVILSPLKYGCYSHSVKAVLERCIPTVLPFFRIIDGEMHHVLRHENSIELTVHFYGDCSEDERTTAKELVRANAVNFGSGKNSVFFHLTEQEAREAVQ